jgi:AAA domain
VCWAARPRWGSSRHIGLDGAALPELSALLVAPRAGPGDPLVAATAADRVRRLVADGVASDAAGAERRLEPADVAVITPHVEQASAIGARLADLPGALIGTANQMQGLEREAVVVIHPLVGYREVPPFAADKGRLCVALSRHRAHATVVLDASTDPVLRRAQAEAPGDTTLAVQRHVLAALLALS